jgi:hypothetical protein
MASRSDDEKKLAGELIQSGEEFAGAAVGGALGLLGGPVGVAAGAAGGVVATRAFRKVGAQLRQRWLDPREEVRVGGAFALAAARIAERADAGERLRTDGFFDDEGTGNRTQADEVLEERSKRLLQRMKSERSRTSRRCTRTSRSATTSAFHMQTP